jgi:hypothetical protein
MHQCCLFVRGTVSKIHLTSMVHFTHGGRGGRRASLRIAHQNFPPSYLGRIAIKSLMHYIQACATAPDKTCALRALRESDKLRKQVGSAPCASHQLAALLY